jgi:acetyltransferase-like isoleucine patch superfamily enzyme
MKSKIKKFNNLPLSKKLLVIFNVYLKIKSNTLYKVLFKKIGKNSLIKKPLFLTPEFISLGNGVKIWNDARIEGISSYAYQSFQPHIIIEDGVSIQQRFHMTAAGTLIIGKNTLISFDVSVQDTDHEYKNIDLPVANQPLEVKRTQVGENCFIGSGAKIQAGTILGKHCVIGTSAVVRGTFPDYCVIVGAPAKIVKRYCKQTHRWERTNKLGKFLDEI